MQCIANWRNLFKFGHCACSIAASGNSSYNSPITNIQPATRRRSGLFKIAYFNTDVRIEKHRENLHTKRGHFFASFPIFPLFVHFFLFLLKKFAFFSRFQLSAVAAKNRIKCASI
jgi:hypothetical protein